VKRYFVDLSYDGTHYHGWQIQHNAHTVQQVLNDAFSLILRTPVKLTGCGRTDAGVHAGNYFAHFDLEKELSHEQCRKLAFKLNGYLDDDISIREIFPVKPGIHSRFSAKSRTYKYFITREKDPFLVNKAFYLYGKIDIALMNEAASWLKTIRDFTSFSKVGSDTKTNICLVHEAVWKEEGHCLVFTITADRFLRNMVRAVVGTLVDLGTGKTDMEGFKEITHSKNRCNAGDSVPACGLFLEKIEYPENIRE